MAVLGEVLNGCRRARPLVHCISNHVSSNDCANLLLACGASPIMADAPQEAAQITAGCAALVLNLGTPSADKLEAMLRSGEVANGQGLPVVFDPVGVGASSFRRAAAERLMRQVRLSVIRGNADEVAALLRGCATHDGVDAQARASDAAQAVALARQTGATVLMTGDADVVTDGATTYLCRNGHPMMRYVTGAGCMLSALTGAYAAASPRAPLTAALAAACAMGVCGERAYARLGDAEGNASYRNYIIDAVYRLDAEGLEGEADYDVF